MDLLFLVVLTFSPGFLWIGFFRRKDRHRAEPWSALLVAFLYGVLAVVPAFLLEMPFRFLFGEGIVDQLLSSFFVVGPIEETVKFLALYLASYRLLAFDEVVDGIMYGVAVAVGFSVFENFLYVYRFGILVAPFRAVLATFAHISFLGIQGYYLGLLKTKRGSRKLLLWGVLLASFFHGLYDFILLSLIPSIFALLLLIALYYLLQRLLQKALYLP